ncbi:MAG: metallophosphoesterase [Gemmiger sp.]|nr:metallophosphoesterase [Gemmiger sp.]
MYNRFVQFTIPSIGQLLVALVLYANFLQLPFIAMFQPDNPLLYYCLPLALMALASYLSRDPLGVGMIWMAFLTGLYVVGDVVSFALWRVGGTPWQVWQAVYGGGLLVWGLTCALVLYGWVHAHKLYTTHYRLATPKALPGGKLRLVQISDLHPGSTMTRQRIPELRQKIEALAPDILVFTGDIYDENTVREDFDAFNALFGELQAPYGKWFVYGNHDLGHHWREPQYDRADLERAFAGAGIRILEDVSVLAGETDTPHPVRIVGRKDWLYTEHRRFSAAELLPDGPDGRYTILLDHEPRELKAAAAAGADLILCGHTHGGKIWPLGLVSRLFRFNEVNYGKRQITPSCAAIVSGGTGTWSYQIRTEGRTEIVCVDITQAGTPAPPPKAGEEAI